VRIYSLLPADRDPRAHPEAVSAAEGVTVLPLPSWAGLPAFLGALRRALFRAPVRTLIELARWLVWPTRRAFRCLFRAIVLADRMRREDVVHLHAAWAHTPAGVALVASRLTRIPWSMGAHAKDIHLTRPSMLATRLSAARFTLACCAAHRTLLQDIARRHGDPAAADRVELIHHGVDTEFFSPPACREPRGEGATILSVGRLVPKKGFDVLLDAAAILHRRGARFTLDIAGEGPLRVWLEARIAELGLEAVVRLHGAWIRTEVRDAMRRADAFVLASRVTAEGDRDGIPNTLAEAMAAELPVVASRLPSIEELVVDGTSGLLVASEDAAALADALQRLIDEPDLSLRLGAAARARILDRFDCRRSNAVRVARFERCRSVQRVLYVSADRGVPVRGHKGASVHVRSLLHAWKSLGIEARLLTTRSGPADGPAPGAEIVQAKAGAGMESVVRGVARALRGGAPLERALSRLADHGALLRAGFQGTRRSPPDFVYERYSLASVAGRILACRLGVPHLLEVNAPLADEEARYRGLRLGRLTRWIEGWLMRGADRVFVVSTALEAHARRLGVRPERIVVLPNAVDPNWFHAAREGDEARARIGLDGGVVVGFAGSLKPWHGVHRLVRAVALASPRTSIELLVIGEGPEREALARLAATCGITGRVRFTGPVAHESVGAYLAACDILCAPYEPADDFYFSPLKIAEYLAVGRPVVASAVGSLRETLDEDRGAVLVPPGDEEALANALVDLALDPVRRAALGRVAATSAGPTWSDVASRVATEATRARAASWRLPMACPLTVGYVVKMFPRFSETFILNEILEIERLGVGTVVFSMKPPIEPYRQPGVERLRAEVHVLPTATLGVRIVFAHLACLSRAPWRYLWTLAFVAGRRTRSAWSKFLVAPCLVREARRRKVGHFHAHFASGPARQAKLASMLSGIPFSFTAHARDLFWSGHQHGRNHKLKKRVRMAAFVVAISEYNRRFIEELGFKIPHGRVLTIYNGVNLDSWPWARPLGRPAAIPLAGRLSADPDDPWILAVGRLVEKKGFHVLIEACQRLRDRGCAFRCVIAGEGPERQRLVDHVHATDLEDVVTFLGPVPQDRLASELYARAHVLAQPCIVDRDGDQDGIPTVILEAMATGLPVVTTPVSGIGEAVVDGASGLVVPSGDPERLADALERVLVDDALAARLGRGARRRIEIRFDLRRNASVLVHLMTTSAHHGYRGSLASIREAMGLDSPTNHAGGVDGGMAHAEGDALPTSPSSEPQAQESSR
jgi:glycosyltransferase involved in cell wall biosynthesis